MHIAARSFIALVAIVLACAAQAAPPWLVSTQNGNEAQIAVSTSPFTATQTGGWALYTGRIKDATTGVIALNSEVFAARTDGSGSVRLSLDPATGDPAARGCSFADASSDGRFVVMLCNESGWFPEYADPFLQSPHFTEVVLMDRDADADGVFDEPGEVTIRSATDLVGGFRIPYRSDLGPSQKTMTAISGDGRRIAISGPMYPTAEFSTCLSKLMLLDRDTDEDGIFDEDGAWSFGCVDTSYSFTVTRMMFAADGSRLLVNGWVTGVAGGSPNSGYDGAVVEYVLATDTAIVRSLDASGVPMTDSVSLRAVSADGSVLLLDTKSEAHRPAELPTDTMHSYRVDVATNTWYSPLVLDPRLAAREEDGEIGSWLSPDGEEMMILAYGVWDFWINPKRQAYMWRVGETEIVRRSGYGDGNQTLQQVVNAAFDAESRRVLLITPETGLLSEPTASTSVAVGFDAANDAWLDPRLFLSANADTRIGVWSQFQLNAFPRMVGSTNSVGKIEITIGPLDDFRVLWVSPSCVEEASSIVCRDLRFDPYPAIDAVVANLQPLRSGTLPLPIHMVTATADDDPSNDSFEGEIEVLESASLGTVVSAPAGEYHVGDSMGFGYSVRNETSTTPADIRLTLTLPVGATLIENRFRYRDADVSCSISGQTIECDLSAVPSGDSANGLVFIRPDVIGNKAVMSQVTSPTHSLLTIAGTIAAGTGRVVDPSTTGGSGGGGGGSGSGEGDGGGGGGSTGLFELLALAAALRRASRANRQGSEA